MGQAVRWKWKPPSMPDLSVYGHEHRAEQCRGKVPYQTRREAKAAKRRLKERHGRDYSVYRCPYCCRWHLTTRRIGADKWRR